MHIPVAPKTRTRKWPESEDASCDLNSQLFLDRPILQVEWVKTAADVN